MSLDVYLKDPTSTYEVDYLYTSNITSPITRTFMSEKAAMCFLKLTLIYLRLLSFFLSHLESSVRMRHKIFAHIWAHQKLHQALN